MKDMNNRGSRRHHESGHDGADHNDFDARGFEPGDFAPRGPGRRGRHPGFVPGPGFGPGPRRGPRGGRARGDVRTAVLVLLAEQPRHGYDLMRGIDERSNGLWSPSPGSIYPTLQALEDEGLITFETVDGRKTASVTDAGQAWLADHAPEVEAVFAQHEGAAKAIELRKEIHQLRDVVMLAARQGGETADKAAVILASARRELYGLLSGDN